MALINSQQYSKVDKTKKSGRRFEFSNQSKFSVPNYEDTLWFDAPTRTICKFYFKVTYTSLVKNNNIIIILLLLQ